MVIEKVAAVYFSPTGTTCRMVNHIASELAQHLHLPKENYDFTLPENRREMLSFHEKELVIFGIPVYAGRVPNVLLPYLNEYIQGKQTFTVPIVLYGNRNYDDALIELRNILVEHSFLPIAAGAFIGEHSFSTILAAHRPDERDLEKASAFAKEIAERVNIQINPATTPLIVTGRDPIGPYYRPQDRKGNPINILKVTPKVNERCVHCGICAQVCPMGSIDPEHVDQYRGICIKCGACEKKCPQQARYYDDKGYIYHRTELEEGYIRRAEPEIFF